MKPGAEGGTVAAKELRDALSTWWVCRAPGKPVPTAKALGMAMTRCGLRSVKRGGRRRYEGVVLLPLGVA